MDEREQMLQKYRALCFAKVDLGLFLDSHPGNTDAIKTYHGLCEDAAALKKQYEETFGPITAGGERGGDYWTWVASPFPWENC